MKILSAVFMITILTVSTAYDDVDDTINFEAMMNTPMELRTLLDCYLDIVICPPKFLPYRRKYDEKMFSTFVTV